MIFQPIRHLTGSLCFLTGHIRLFGPGELPKRLGGGWGYCGKEVPAHYKSEMEGLEGCSIGKVSDRVGFRVEGSE